MYLYIKIVTKTKTRHFTIINSFKSIIELIFA